MNQKYQERDWNNRLSPEPQIKHDHTDCFLHGIAYGTVEKAVSEFEKQYQQLLTRFPDAFDIKVEHDTWQSGEDGACSSLRLEFKRPETEKEVRERIYEAKRTDERTALSERQTFERLKKKFDLPS